MAEDDVPSRVHRHRATMNDKSVAVLENTHLADRESGLGWEIGPPGHQWKEAEEEAEEVDRRWSEVAGKVAGIAAEHGRPLAS
jgi:hypothetical protein